MARSASSAAGPSSSTPIPRLVTATVAGEPPAGAAPALPRRGLALVPTGERVTRQRLIDTALTMVEEDGVGQLSMRKLAAELGVAVTAIYWHVGNREALLDALVERELADMGAIRARGSTPEARLRSIARSLHAKLLARPHLIGL